MNKQREEIIKTVENTNEYILIKNETGIHKKNIITSLAILIGAIFILYYFIAEYRTNRSGNSNIIGYTFMLILFGVSILITCLLLFTKYRLLINGKSKVIDISYFVFKSIPIEKKQIEIYDGDTLFLVRLNIASLYLDGVSIKQIFKVYNKYNIYLIRKNYGYERIIGFNNYIEAKNSILKISSYINVAIKDTTENEYRDEDEFISSYIRYRELVKEVKEEQQD